MNRTSATPLYKQIYDSIKNDIATGKLKENEKIPTETELCELYATSRITVRKAIELLTEDGLVIKKQGIGTFISAKKLNRVMDKVMSFSEICINDHKVPSAELISVGWVKPTAAVVRELKIPEDEKVIRIYRLRLSNEEPVMLEETFFSQEYKYLLSTNLTASIYDCLRAHGCFPAHAKKVVEICYAKEHEAKSLHVPNKQPLILQKDTVAAEDGTIIHYSRLVVNPERYTLTFIN